MIALWITVGLILSAISVSSLGAYFSIVGLGVLFSGAHIAVWIMAGALEFSKFVLAAYLHQAWKNLGYVYKSYLTFAVITLSIITSIGIFGFLSDAYQSSSSVLTTQNVNLENLKNQQTFYREEIARLNKSVDEIPATRVTRRMKLRAEIEPRVLEMSKKIEENERILGEAKLKHVDIEKKVGPLIFIAKAFNLEIDAVVRYLIIIFVSVFDPLAICLVIASTQAMDSRRNRPTTTIKEVAKAESSEVKVEAPAPIAEVVPLVPPVEAAHTETPPPETEPEPSADAETDSDIIVQMNFKDAPVLQASEPMPTESIEPDKKAV